ncbi:hypothetical protein RJ640_018734 [Escallonia rubra]|uniref:Uncharacterized protein n=1 Tax=Escallonia rubra TaxID=112253 RepID=A0AA88QAC3_9ASTE|nr:hypothetical protein RJ640_018734 [Escallonia rubra]
MGHKVHVQTKIGFYLITLESTPLEANRTLHCREETQVFTNDKTPLSTTTMFLTHFSLDKLVQPVSSEWHIEGRNLEFKVVIKLRKRGLKESFEVVTMTVHLDEMKITGFVDQLMVSVSKAEGTDYKGSKQPNMSDMSLLADDEPTPVEIRPISALMRCERLLEVVGRPMTLPKLGVFHYINWLAALIGNEKAAASGEDCSFRFRVSDQLSLELRPCLISDHVVSIKIGMLLAVLFANTQMLKTYEGNLVAFSKCARGFKASDFTPEELAIATQVQGLFMPIGREKPAVEFVKVTDEMKSFNAYAKLRLEWANERHAGARLKRAAEPEKRSRSVMDKSAIWIWCSALGKGQGVDFKPVVIEGCGGKF